jgi:hypothetical protein
MSPYRGSDAELEREIAAVRGLVPVRVRRASEDLRELERALADLRRELRRRRARTDLVEPAEGEGEVGT